MTTTDDRWTAETEELVARALHAVEHQDWRSCAVDEPPHEQTPWFIDRARTILERCDEFQPCPEIGSLASRLGVSVDG